MKCVIIGGSAAGLSAAEEMRRLEKNAEITVISSEDKVYSRCMLHKYLGGERTESSMRFVPENFFEKHNIRYMEGRSVVSIKEAEHEIVLDDGRTVSYDRLLIASGASYFVPPIPNFRDAENLFGFRGIDDVKAIVRGAGRLGTRGVIIGGGLVGLDAAYGMLLRGYQVTVIEREPRLMPLQTDDYVSGLYQKAFERAGCRILLGVEVKDSVIDSKDRITSVILSDESEVSCDFVVAAASVKPQMDFLEGTSIQALYMNYHIHTVLSRFLRKTDIHVNKGLEVNDQMQTSSPDIYAAGDVTGLSAIWPDARLMGRVAARNICGRRENAPELFQFKNTSNFFGIPMFSAGKTVVDESRYEILVRKSRKSYRKVILRDGIMQGAIFTGDLANAGVYLYAISHELNIEGVKDHIFNLSFADWYGIDEKNGEYCYRTEG